MNLEFFFSPAAYKGHTITKLDLMKHLENSFFKDFDKDKIRDLIKTTEQEINESEISDQAKYLADQKIETLRSIN